MKKNKLSKTEAKRRGANGGKKTLDLHGKSHFINAAKKRWELHKKISPSQK